MPPMGLNVLDAHVDINMHRMMADHSLHNPALLPLPAAAGRSLEGCGWGVTGVLGLGAGQQMAELARNTFRSAWIGEREAYVAAVEGMSVGVSLYIRHLMQ